MRTAGFHRPRPSRRRPSAWTGRIPAFWLLGSAWAGQLAGQTVTNVRATQRSDKSVELLYDLSGAISPGATVSVAFSNDGGASYGIVPAISTLSGNIGAAVVNGTNRRIVWNAAATLPSGTYATTYRAAVTAVNPIGPAAGSLVVELEPVPGGSRTPLSNGGTVFVGSRLRVSPAVTPPPSLAPLSDWRLDLNFHPGKSYDDGGSGASPRLLHPDVASSTVGSVPSSSYVLVGPCDPAAGGVPATGAGCWSSVLTNAAQGGPDFSAAPPAGTTKQLSIAFEARNAVGSAGATVFTLSWKVPAVRLRSTSVLLGGALEDASDGSPLTSGYKWYFASVPDGAPGSEILQQDTACTGRTCVHAFPQRGAFGYWLKVPYPNGYASPDCPAPCSQRLGVVLVNDGSWP